MVPVLLGLVAVQGTALTLDRPMGLILILQRVCNTTSPGKQSGHIGALSAAAPDGLAVTPRELG